MLESERYVRQALLDLPLAALGAKVREKRLALGFSIRDLAAQALVSKTSIVNMEQGRACRPSTLIRVCSAMGLHVARFLEPEPPAPSPSARVHRRADDRWFPLDEVASGPLSAEERSHLASRMLMFANVPLGAGFVAGIIEVAAPTPPRRHPGREWVYVLRGEAMIRIGNDAFKLKEGENVYFEGGDEHSYAPFSSTPAELLVLRID